MDLRHLRYFVAVADTLHFGRAAAALGMSQPPLSQQIRALEEELGVDLLERTSRRVVLTEAGRLFLTEARRTLAQADHAADVARRAARGETGELSIGFTSSVPLVPRVADALYAYRSAYPAVHLNLVEMTRDAQIAALAEGRLELGFVRGFAVPVLPDGVTASIVLEEGLDVAVHRDDRLARRPGPLHLDDLAQAPFILYEPALGAGFNEHLLELCRASGFQPRVVQEAGGLASLLGLVAARLGVTVVARSLSALTLPGIVHVPLVGEGTLSRLWLLGAAGAAPAARNFARLLDPQSSPDRHSRSRFIDGP